jgi:hypothetical protein
MHETSAVTADTRGHSYISASARNYILTIKGFNTARGGEIFDLNQTCVAEKGGRSVRSAQQKPKLVKRGLRRNFLRVMRLKGIGRLVGIEKAGTNGQISLPRSFAGRSQAVPPRCDCDAINCRAG